MRQPAEGTRMISFIQAIKLFFIFFCVGVDWMIDIYKDSGGAISRTPISSSHRIKPGLKAKKKGMTST
jgi:hypothetical protein